MCFILIYWNIMSDSDFLGGSFFLKYWKNGCFSGLIWRDLGNTVRTKMAGLGSIGLTYMAYWVLGREELPQRFLYLIHVFHYFSSNHNLH